MSRIITRAVFAATAAATLTSCHGGSSATPPVPRTATKSGQVSVTVTRAMPSPSTAAARRPSDIPASAASVDAVIYVGKSASGTPASSGCTTFPAGASQVTLTFSAPYGTDTVVISAWSGPCSGSGGAGSTGTGTMLTTFAGTGTINGPTGTVSAVFNAGNPVVLGIVLPPASNVPVSPTLTAIGPTFRVGSGLFAGTGAAGKVQSFALSQSDPSTMYVAGGSGHGMEPETDAGIYRTTDGGNTWAPIVNGLTDTVVNDLYLDQSHPSVLLAATQTGGIFRSTDGGNSWVWVFGGGFSYVGAYQFATLGSDIYAATDSGILVSHDDGATWSMSLSIPYTGRPSALGSGGGVLYAGIDGEQFYAYVNGAWVQRTSLPIPPSFTTPTGVNEIVVDPASPMTVYATAWGSSPSGFPTDVLYVSADGGQSWTLANTPSGWWGTQMLAMSAVTPHKVYAGAESAQAYSTDGGATWTKQESGGDQRGMYVYASGGQDACYITSDQGLWYFPLCGSNTGAKNLTQGLSINLIYGSAVHGSTLIAMMQDFSPAVSFDGGATWTWPTGTFWEDGDAAINPYAPQYCYANDNNGYEYSTDGCKTFTADFSSATTHLSGWVFDPANPANVFASNLVNGTWTEEESTDFGKTYAPLSWPMQPWQVLNDPTNDRHIVVYDKFSGSPGLYVSLDGGKTWTLGMGNACGPIAMDPQQPDIVISVCGQFVYRSTNGGFSYAEISATGLGALATRKLRPSVTAPLFDGPALRPNDRRGASLHREADGDSLQLWPLDDAPLAFDDRGTVPYLAFATGYGLYVSTDWGSDWQRIDTATVSHVFTKVQWSGGSLYAASIGQGFLKSSPLQ